MASTHDHDEGGIDHMGLLHVFKKGPSSGSKEYCVVLQDLFLFCLPKREASSAQPDLTHPLFMVFLAKGSVDVIPDSLVPNGLFVSQYGREDVYMYARSAEERAKWLVAIQKAIVGPETEHFLENLEEQSKLNAFTLTEESVSKLQQALAPLKGKEQKLDSDSDDTGSTVSSHFAESAPHSQRGSSDDEADFPRTHTRSSSGVHSLKRSSKPSDEDLPAVIPFPPPADVRAKPFDKQAIYAQIKAMRDSLDKESLASEKSSLQAELTVLRSHRQVLAKEVTRLKSESTIHHRALEQAQQELETLTGAAEKREHSIIQWTAVIVGLQKRFHDADPDARQAAHAKRRKELEQAHALERKTGSGSLSESGSAAPAAVSRTTSGSRDTDAPVDEMQLLEMSNAALAELDAECQDILQKLRGRSGSGSTATKKVEQQLSTSLLQLLRDNISLRVQLNSEYKQIYRMTQEKLEAFRTRVQT